MAEYIDREELLNNRPEGRNPKQIGKEEYNRGWNDCRSAFYALIEDMPAANVAPARHGKWGSNGIPDSVLSACSVCGFGCGAYSFYYCPNCGAKMDGE